MLELSDFSVAKFVVMLELSDFSVAKFVRQPNY